MAQVAAPEPMDVACEDDTHTSVADISELIDINISRIDAMQDHWCAADECFKRVWLQLYAYRIKNIGQYHDRLYIYQLPDTMMLILCLIALTSHITSHC